MTQKKSIGLILRKNNISNIFINFVLIVLYLFYLFSFFVMKRIICLISLLIIVFSDVQAQKYWVFFTNKKDVGFNPYEYFDEKAIERRQNLGISLYDSTDYAVNQNYVQEIFENVDTILTQSRWFNACLLYTSPSPRDRTRSRMPSSA